MLYYPLRKNNELIAYIEIDEWYVTAWTAEPNERNLSVNETNHAIEAWRQFQVYRDAHADEKNMIQPHRKAEAETNILIAGVKTIPWKEVEKFAKESN